MPKKYIPTAKDKAHAEEIKKLQTTVRKWQKCYQDALIERESLLSEISKLKSELALFQNNTGITPEEIKSYMERTQQMSEMLNFLMKGCNYYG